jgi:hypothetical protein
MIYHHRKEFEESIAKINEQVSRFVDREQTSVQQIFPHYFERYVTDGVEFNIYIGQTLSPRKKFDELYYCEYEDVAIDHVGESITSYP